MNNKNLTDDEKFFLNKQVMSNSEEVKLDIKNIVSNIPSDNEILLLGENTHGTKEFYTHRSFITKYMIENMGYKVVLLEAEWPDIIRVNKYIQGESIYNSAKESLSGIKKFPSWMWNNSPTYELIEWLKEYNLHHPFNMVYVFGIDCQQFLKSIKFILDYLKTHNHPFYEKAHLVFAIFRQFITESQYAVGAVHGSMKPMVNNIVGNLQGLLSTFQWEHVDAFLDDPDNSKKDKLDRISCEQSFEIIVNSEEYFRKMLEEPPGSNASWNTRDQHMLMTIMRIRNRLSQVNKDMPKIIVWAHNSHIGNSDATSRGGKTFANNNSWNVGQMVKEMFPKSIAIGFYTNIGNVTAAEKDKRIGLTQELNSAHPLSYEYLFSNLCHHLKVTEFYIDLRKYNNYKSDNNDITVKLNTPYRDIYTGEQFTPVNVFTDEKKMSYLIDCNNKKHLFVNPYGTIVKRCRQLNGFEYADNFSLYNSDLLQRWIGVNYVKETEMDSHYGESKLAQQFDFVVFINETTFLD
tara:strand:- start:3228 stop:4781 length:1554 start_codon:yes stop_codon:yes gene_type:complete